MITNVLSVKACEIIDSSTRERFLDNEYLDFWNYLLLKVRTGVVQEEPVLPIDVERQPSEHSDFQDGTYI